MNVFARTVAHLERLGGMIVHPRATLAAILAANEASRDPASRDPASRDPASRDPASRDPKSRDRGARAGGLGVMLAWAALLSCTLQPVGAGQALLLLRTSPFDGLVSLLSLVASRMSLALGGVIGAAVVLAVLERVRVPADARRGFDAALDASAWLLVPYFLLATVGHLLAASGLDLYWMPHHTVRGRVGDRALEAFVAYGWSLVLYAVLVQVFLAPRREPPGDPPSVT